jgi:hypothetical protein
MSYVKLPGASAGVVRPSREVERHEIEELGRQVGERHVAARGRAVRTRSHSGRGVRPLLARVHWSLVVTLGVLAGLTVGLVIALVLLPDQPERVLVPVDQPSGFVIEPKDMRA